MGTYKELNEPADYLSIIVDYDDWFLYGSPEGPSIISTISILFPFYSSILWISIHSLLAFWDFHSINVRIITHMRKFFVRTQCARHNEYVHVR